MWMYVDGHVPASNASMPRSKDILQLHFTPGTRFDVVHINLVGPLPLSQGFTYLLACVDCFPSLSQQLQQRLLLKPLSMVGLPALVSPPGSSLIVADNSNPICGRHWWTCSAAMTTHNCLLPAVQWHMVELFHRQLKAALKAQPNPTAWMDALPLVLLGIWTALKEDTSSTAAEMVYGGTLRLPGEFFTAPLNPPLQIHLII